MKNAREPIASEKKEGKLWDLTQTIQGMQGQQLCLEPLCGREQILEYHSVQE